jgi:hypothetical protein
MAFIEVVGPDASDSFDIGRVLVEHLFVVNDALLKVTDVLEKCICYGKNFE